MAVIIVRARGMVLGKINNVPKVIWLAAIQRLKTRPLLSLQQKVSCVHLMSDLLEDANRCQTSEYFSILWN